MITPPRLHTGDTVGIVATGKRVTPADLETAIATLQSWGLQVKPGKHLYSTDHAYLAGTDEQRLTDFQAMIDDVSVKAIFCARGGYGSTRIVDDVDFFSMKTHAKWIVGFSDVTAIHLMLSGLGIQSIHSIMPINFARDEAKPSVESLRRMLFEKADSIYANGSPLNKTGHGNGQLIGGNLSLLVDALGTSTDPDTDGKILVLEEIDEYLYRIDRMMMSLKRAGKLDNLAGLVAGHFSDIKDAELFGGTAYDIIALHTKEYDYPVGYNFQIGHEPLNMPWIEGATADLTVKPEGSSISFGV
jgi:muramoyltetrapeptide carboxypeptidase